MGVLIDTSVLIDHERGRIDLAAVVEGRADEEFFLSVVSASELLHGVHREADQGVRARRSAFVEAVLEEFPLLGIDVLTTRTHAQLWAELAGQGTRVGAHDLWLAATCVARGISLATGDAREFEHVAGLNIEVWST